MTDNIQNQSCPVSGCGCVGYAYVPIQYMDTVYSACESLENGTLFPELNLTIDKYSKVCNQTGGTL